MILFILWGFLTCALFVESEAHTEDAKVLKINVFSLSNGRGLEVDQNIMRHELEALGHRLRVLNVSKAANNQNLADITLSLLMRLRQ